MSGIVGLAFPSATRSCDSFTNTTVTYSSLMNTLFSQFSVPKIWSLALTRDNSYNNASSHNNGGIFTIGGIPPLDSPSVNVSSTDYALAPFQYSCNTSCTRYSFYWIGVDSFVLGTEQIGPNISAIVDSGYNGLEIPAAAATAINAAWTPTGRAIGSNVFLDCEAALSTPLSIGIGGKTFPIQSKDLIGQMNNGSCYSLVMAGFPPNGYSLGDPLLKNTLAVFDWERSSMAFYERTQYQS